MTLLTVAQEVCPFIGLEVPAAIVGSGEREHIELLALANEMAKRIAFDGHDWTKLKTLATLTGNGSAETFSYPANYKRMLKKAQLWPSGSPFAPLRHYPDSDQWLGMQVQNFQAIVGGWTLLGDTIGIRPAMANGATAKFYYITDLIVSPNTPGTNKAAFTLDNDSFRLDERLLKLGMIWQWKANKGRPYSEDMTNFEEALGTAVGADKGSNLLVVGAVRTPVGVEFAFPGSITP